MTRKKRKLIERPKPDRRKKFKKVRGKPRWQTKIDEKRDLEAPPGGLEIPWEVSETTFFKLIDARNIAFWERHQLVSKVEWKEKGRQYRFLAVERVPREEMILRHVFVSHTPPPHHIIAEYETFRRECRQ